MTEFDLNKDGKVTEEEILLHEKKLEIENRDQKEGQQRKMAWIAMISMIVATVFLFLPIIPNDRVSALSDLLGLFYIAQAGIVASFFGASAYMNVKR